MHRQSSTPLPSRLWRMRFRSRGWYAICPRGNHDMATPLELSPLDMLIVRCGRKITSPQPGPTTQHPARHPRPSTRLRREIVRCHPSSLRQTQHLRAPGRWNTAIHIRAGCLSAKEPWNRQESSNALSGHWQLIGASLWDKGIARTKRHLASGRLIKGIGRKSAPCLSHSSTLTQKLI